MANAVSLKILTSGVALITFDQPDKKVNLLSEGFMRELNDALDQVAGNTSIKGLVFASGKDDNFIAGANVDEIRKLQEDGPAAVAGSRLGKQIFARIAALPYNTVAAINGSCMGGGTELALACKFRVASTSKKTRISVPEVQLGFLPGWGGAVRLPHVVGFEQAMMMVTTGAEQDARKAYKIRLVDDTVAPEQLLARAEEIALTGRVKRAPYKFKQKAMDWAMHTVLKGKVIATVKAKSKGYLAPAAALKVLLKSANEGMTDAAFELESNTFGTLATSDVSKNLVGVFFAREESRKMPENFAPSITVKTVGVLGAGVMGAGIAQAALYAGYDVVLKDVKQEFLDKGVATIRGLIDGLVERKKLSADEAQAMLARLHPTLDYAEMKDCDLVIEAVLEVMKVKQDCIASLDAAIVKPYIFASNTSSLSINEMAASARHPQNVVGLHFFNPVHKMPLVEVVRGKETSDTTIGVTKSFAMKLGKTTVVTEDAPGFVVNRILAPYMLEAIRLFEDGVPPEDIEKAMKTFGMPMGPLELLDEVGLDIAAHVVNTMHGALGERMAPPAVLETLKGMKLLGRKGGKGIYLFDKAGGSKIKDKKTKKYVFNPEVLAAIKAPRSPKTMGEIQDRLVLAMVNEAARVMEEGVVSEPSQLDLAMLFGTGFPPYRGGVLRYADQQGLPDVAQKLTWLSKVASGNYAPAALVSAKAAAGRKFYN